MAAPSPARPSAGLNQVEREQLAALGRLEALTTPHGNPLTVVDVIPRAAAVLLALGEDPRRVGEVLLGAPPSTAARRARAALRVARQIIRPATIHLHTRRRARLVQLIPNPRRRWTLLLRMSGAFDQVDQIADALHVDRATCYRDLQACHGILRDYYVARREARA